MPGCDPSASVCPTCLAAAAPSPNFSLHTYLSRIGLSESSVRALPSGLAQLAAVMGAHSRAIPFGNLSVLTRQPIDMSVSAVVGKLVGARMDGYCFEQNVLLMEAMRALGIPCTPLLCRVRWNKQAGEETPFTHMALSVAVEGAAWLADVGFAGTNSVAPVAMRAPAQEMPEGRFRTVVGATMPGYETLQWERGGQWRDLYMWRLAPGGGLDQAGPAEVASAPDLAVANFWSCTAPSARFTSSFFVARVVGDERHHILNGRYARRRGLAGDAAVEEERVRDVAHLRVLLAEVFGVERVPEEALREWEAKFKE